MQPTLFNIEAVNAYGNAIAARDAGMAQVEKNAGDEFREKARAFVLAYLRDHGATSSEALTDKCMKVLDPEKRKNSKVMGSIYGQLSKAGLIVCVGTCKRLKGHLSGATSIWELVKQ